MSKKGIHRKIRERINICVTQYSIDYYGKMKANDNKGKYRKRDLKVTTDQKVLGLNPNAVTLIIKGL